MDDDISTATSDIDLQKISLQDARDDAAKHLALAEQRAQAYVDAQKTQHDDRVAALEVQKPVFSAEGEAADRKHELIVALVAKLVPASSAATDATVTELAQGCAKRIKAVLDELLKL